jgi:hypothetical protein
MLHGTNFHTATCDRDDYTSLGLTKLFRGFPRCQENIGKPYGVAQKPRKQRFGRVFPNESTRLHCEGRVQDWLRFGSIGEVLSDARLGGSVQEKPEQDDDRDRDSEHPEQDSAQHIYLPSRCGLPKMNAARAAMFRRLVLWTLELREWSGVPHGGISGTATLRTRVTCRPPVSGGLWTAREAARRMRIGQKY